MQLAGRELFLECLIDTLLPLNAIFANKFCADDQRFEMLSIAIQGEMFAIHASEYELFDLVGVHWCQALSFQPRFNRLSVSKDTARKQDMTTARLVSGATSETPKKP